MKWYYVVLIVAIAWIVAGFLFGMAFGQYIRGRADYSG